MSPSDSEEFKRLRASEEKYRKMIERANDAILSIDPETGTILEVNPKAEQMTGYPAGELVGMNVRDLHPEDEQKMADRLFERVRTAGTGTCNDMHFLKKSGEKVFVNVSASVITFGNYKIIQRICRDVTVRQDLIEQIAAQRDYYEFILNMLPVGLGVRKNVNESPVVEFENKRLTEMFPPDPKSPHCPAWCQATGDGDIPTKTIIDDTGVYAEERQYPNGKTYQFTLSYYRNREESWSELQLIQDVTHRRNLEDQLRLALEDLEQKVEDRTLELRKKQSQLVQAEKMAALGHLVAGIAHEINTPLGALKSNNDLLIRALRRLRDHFGADTVDPRLARVLTGIDELNTVNKDAMERIVKMVNSLRKFARLDEADQDKVDIHEGLDNTLTLVHHEIKNRITVHTDYGDLPKVHCFPNQINQVFMNLIVNAGQAIERKGDIFIKTFQRGNDAIIEIRDTGKGIDPSNLARIFDPGFTTKGVGVGTGLGLSIVYQIMEDHGGTVEVESKIGEGTTFRVVLPIRPPRRTA